MSYAAAQDAQWLNSLPQYLGNAFDNSFWNQPETAKVWFGSDETANYENNIIQFASAARKATHG